VVFLRVKKDLRLVLEAAECLTVEYPIPVALKGGANRIRFLGARTPFGLCGLRRVGTERLKL
jgi:hypothetical protein